MLIALVETGSLPHLHHKHARDHAVAADLRWSEKREGLGIVNSRSHANDEYRIDAPEYSNGVPQGEQRVSERSANGWRAWAETPAICASGLCQYGRSRATKTRVVTDG